MNDPKAVRLVIIILGMVVMSIVVGAIALSWSDRYLPESLIGFGGVALGGIAGILAPSSKNEPQEVEVINKPDDPVIVEEVAN